MSVRFKRARKTMRKAFEKDQDLYRGYLDNVAMLLHDRHGIVDYEKRNHAAKGILKLIFWNK